MVSCRQNISIQAKIKTMDEQKHQLIDRLNQAQNVLVTVSANPSVDQLAAAIGLTLALNKIGKHATAVFSGQAPSTIEFLKPEKTLEKTTDSLRDFIIALDKTKADKLRYKVEDQVVRIFITPYRTSLSEKDLEFSQGDFNVDVVLALGVTDPQDLDSAITAHGRILHDATVASISTQGQGSLGTINWVEPTASSLCEMMVSLVDDLDKKVVDNQIATALLTGIVANTERFRNDKTTPKTMSASAELMAAGANQQLIATELEAPVTLPEPDHETLAEESASTSGRDDGAAHDASEEEKSEPGTLEIEHDSHSSTESQEKPADITVDSDGRLVLSEASNDVGTTADSPVVEEEFKRERLVEPPQLNKSSLTANSSPEDLDPATEELSKPSANDAPMLNRHGAPSLEPLPVPEEPEPPRTGPQPTVTGPLGMPLTTTEPVLEVKPLELPPLPPMPNVQAAAPFTPEPTLSTPNVDSVEIDPLTGAFKKAPDDGTSTNAAPASVDDARNAVEAALKAAAVSEPPAPAPIAALNAVPFGPDLHATPPVAPVPTMVSSEPLPGGTPADQTLDMPLPGVNPFVAGPSPAPASAFPGTPTPTGMSGQTPPPPVPPPMLPPVQ